MKEGMSVYGKVYSHSATGVTPAAVRAPERSLTCSASSCPMYWRLW
jgi:hypothetical protein